jgi:hypothetical protein
MRVVAGARFCVQFEAGKTEMFIRHFSEFFVDLIFKFVYSDLDFFVD